MKASCKKVPEYTREPIIGRAGHYSSFIEDMRFEGIKEFIPASDLGENWYYETSEFEKWKYLSLGYHISWLEVESE